MPDENASRPAVNPRRTLTAMLLLLAASASFLDYWEYSRAFHAEPGIWESTLRGMSAAPQQYRIGVLTAAAWMTRHSPLAMRHALALIDFVSLLVATFTLRDLLLRSAAWRAATIPTRWLGAVGLVLLFAFSLQWLTWYQRPETLAIAALLSVSLWLLTTGLPNVWVAVLALVAISLLLGTIRADAAMAFHAGCATVAVTKHGRSFALRRWVQLGASVVSILAAVAVQVYIIRVLYPLATYGDTARFQLPLNITDPIRLVPFVLFLAPSAWMLAQIVRARRSLPPAQWALLVGSALFLLLWWVVGKVDEVRIFLPFAFLLAPLTVETAMHRLRSFDGREVTA